MNSNLRKCYKKHISPCIFNLMALNLINLINWCCVESDLELLLVLAFMTAVVFLSKSDQGAYLHKSIVLYFHQFNVNG